MDTLLQAINLVAPTLALPPLLLKAFVGVEGGDINHPDGVIQVTASTRDVVLRRMPRPLKLFALGMLDDPSIDDMTLTTLMAQAYVGRNLRVQVMTGAQYIREQLNTFRGYVALAGLAYNAGPTGARRVIDTFGGAMFNTALQFHKGIGPGQNQVTVQPGVEATDGATGQKYTRFPVTANDSGREIFQYMYLRQVPGRNFGLLDFIYQPQLLNARGLYEPTLDLPPGPDTRDHALNVSNGQFQIFTNGEENPISTMFNTQPLSQRDPRWKDIRLGFSSEGRTIGTDGCTLTCLTMVANGFGFNETPATLNDKLKALGPGGGFIDALIVFAGLKRACPGMEVLGLVNCRDVPAPLGDIDAALAAGKPVVVEVDQAPGPTTNFHWVVLIGKQGNDYLMRDPFPVPAESGAALVNARYGLGRPVEQTISFVVYYDGPRKPVPPRPTPDTGKQLVVVVNSDPDIVAAGGLALRSTPVVGNNLIKRLAAGTELAVLEANAAARAKIGVPNQWLNVATNGSQGFVAAWLVQEKSATRAVGKSAAKQPTEHARSIGAHMFSEPDMPPVMQPPLRIPLRIKVKRPVKVTGKTTPVITLRAKPSTGKVIVELKANSMLEVLETSKAASKKIGVRGKWIKVRDSKGNVGYVSGSAVQEESATRGTKKAKG